MGKDLGTEVRSSSDRHASYDNHKDTNPNLSRQPVGPEWAYEATI